MLRENRAEQKSNHVITWYDFEWNKWIKLSLEQFGKGLKNLANAVRQTKRIPSLIEVSDADELTDNLIAKFGKPIHEEEGSQIRVEEFIR